MVQCLLVGTGNFDVSSRFIPALSLTPLTEPLDADQCSFTETDPIEDLVSL